MASEFDDTDYVDADIQAARKLPQLAALGGGAPGRPPTREELDMRVGETQQRLMELKRAQEGLERERAALEEARRRRTEFQTGREEMLQGLTRGVGLLEEAEFNARREAEQMARTLGELREALAKVQALHDETWTQDNYNVELTRALTIIDNARMEWNAARLKWPILSATPESADAPAPAEARPVASLETMGFLGLARLGLALTWPIALVGLAGLGVLLAAFLSGGHK